MVSKICLSLPAPILTITVANAPAEITFLLEEIQAKDSQIMLYKDEISKRDAQLQKWVRLNGGHVLNPKEEAFSRTISECYDKCEILQAEKLGLSEKALIVLERQIRRLDTGLHGLMSREEFPSDWGGPTLIGSGRTSGVGTPTIVVNAGPLQALSNNIGSTGGMPNIGNAAQIRMAAQNAGVQSRGTGSGTQTPTAAPRSQRESSTEAIKRRRLNASLGTLPAASSNLRQSSIGPGTPKAGTPNPVSSRAGSAQPSQRSVTQKKAPGGAATRKLAPPPASKKRSRPSAARKRDRRGQLARSGRSATPSSVASGSATSSRSPSPTPSSLAKNQNDGAPGVDGGDSADEDDEDAGEDGEDTTLYCFCQKVSFGDMVGCDNDNCKYQWFHWGCVNLKHEPEGSWLCPECRKLPRDQVVVSK